MPRTEALIAGFPEHLAYFAQHCPFTDQGQLESHLETRRRLSAFSSPAHAINDVDFMKSLYSTLRAWGIGSRASHLISFEPFIARFQTLGTRINALHGMSIDDASMDIPTVSKSLWDIIDQLAIVENSSRVVPGTKALHHLLPDLLAPIDRKYTQRFFGWHNPQFQYGQCECFFAAFRAFGEIARRTNPAQYLNSRWNSSKTKIIDNAIVGMMRREMP